MSVPSLPSIPSHHLNLLVRLGMHPVTPDLAAEYQDGIQGSNQWSEIRENAIGASEIDLIAGTSFFGNGDDLLKNKFGIVKYTSSMNHGRDFEDLYALNYKKVGHEF